MLVIGKKIKLHPRRALAGLWAKARAPDFTNKL